MNFARDIADFGMRFGEDTSGGQTFIYRGKHWSCIAGGLVRGEVMSEAGPPIEQLTRKLFVRKSAIRPIRTADASEGWSGDGSSPTGDADVMPPHPGKLVVFEKRKYRVATVEEDSDGSAWIVHLISAEQ